MPPESALLRVEIRSDDADPNLQPEFQRRLRHYQADIENCELTRVYWFSGHASPAQIHALCHKVLTHPLIESYGTKAQQPSLPEFAYTITPIRGPTETQRQNLEQVIKSLGIKTLGPKMLGRCLRGRWRKTSQRLTSTELGQLTEFWLFNPLIEQLNPGLEFTQARRRVQAPQPSFELRKLSDEGLIALSRQLRLGLNLEEMQTIQSSYRSSQRTATLLELESFAQTWSEHCVHKTFQATVHHGPEFFANLFAETIVAATKRIDSPLTVSVFTDNAGIVKFDEQVNLCFKAETHNHPSVLEPYHGSATGLGGVIRDILGAGLGARPIMSTNVFGFAEIVAGEPDSQDLASGMSQRYLQSRIIAGLRDYGNRVGVPTAAGGVYCHPSYAHNPIVLAGCLGVLAADQPPKRPRKADLIVLVGGLTGRDGIHGVTFSSEALQFDRWPKDREAVQIGDPLTEQRLIEALLKASESGYLQSVTDCGGGGLCSAVGEMAAELGVEVDLARVPCQAPDLSPRDIWISESQERMILAVAKEHLEPLRELFLQAGVSCTKIGELTGDGRLRLRFHERELANLGMAELHGSRPQRILKSKPPKPLRKTIDPHRLRRLDQALRAVVHTTLLQCLGHKDVCSRESLVRQYDHEVQGRTAQGPFAGPGSGPQDGVVVMPRLDSKRAAVLGLGCQARYSEDPYRMAANSVDEAFRNVVAAGADPRTVVLLDNFIWGNIQDPEELGAFVEAAKACRDQAIAFGAPFISGKDSLNNTFIDGQSESRSIRPTLVISALGQIPNVELSLSMDLKMPGNLLLLLGPSFPEFQGSCLSEVFGPWPSHWASCAPKVRAKQHLQRAQSIYRLAGLEFLEAVHDCSDGGVLTAIAEMCLAGQLGARIQSQTISASFATALFAESSGRYILEVQSQNLEQVKTILARDIYCVIGTVTQSQQLGLDDLVSWQLSELERAFFRKNCEL